MMKIDTKTNMRTTRTIKEKLEGDFKSINALHNIVCQSNWRSEIDTNVHQMEKADDLSDILCTVLVPQEHPVFQSFDVLSPSFRLLERLHVQPSVLHRAVSYIPQVLLYLITHVERLP